jgi:hypothetical protein
VRPAGKFPGDARKRAYEQQQGDPAGHALIPFPGLSPETSSSTRTP